ncbi:exodeoxyribonuclease V subunit gamma [Prochlorococcus marinus]|uniref:Possible exodeoxyribonuclease V subunit C 125 kD polypeptide n=1 Tax=Prochlorococcus marinus (strain MIT 9211) TaxID=93059 RepID=A9BB00_PROM4|nr:exodeoxyribonuclease V subunit gamma [Prochlorococcus marinus]ABX09012.1 possible exodeoxyribonuclease V subunit C 125 kD polypeptide [Prochlorococcus marinus str. MIT 9211]
MLTIYRSNRAEWLANVLAEQLRANPPGLSENVEIVVNTWPTGRWLGEEIAKINGISALVRFPFPAAQLKTLVRKFLGIEVINDDDPWEANQLIWPILNSLPELLQKEEAGVLQKWLERDLSQSGKLSRDEWQLAKTIAYTFDEYIMYRPDVISDWWGTENEINNLKSKLPKYIQWQPILINLLKQRITQEPFGLQVRNVASKLKKGIAPKQNLPSDLRIFGINSLAPVQLELIQALSCIMEVKVFLLTPCKDLWSRCKTKREEYGEGWKVANDKLWLLNKQRLEATLGRMGSEFEQLLEGSGEYQLGEWDEKDLFAMPATIALNKQRKPTLLEQIQQRLVTNECIEPLQRSLDDSSISFTECPGPKRQIQIVRDQILQQLALNKNLEPKDILIMTPQVEKFAHLIPSIFNDVSATGVTLPWKITDRSQYDQPGLTQCIILLMEIACTRLTASNLDQLLTNPVIKDLYKLDDSEIDKITNCLQETGFRWGINSLERDGEETHTLNWCLERWLVGMVIPTIPGLVLGGIAPFSKGISISELSKWWEILSKICNMLQGLRQSHSCMKWGLVLKGLCDDLCNNDRKWSWERQRFLRAIDDWIRAADCFKKEIKIEVVAEIVKDLIAKEAGRFGHRTGRITISALEPMRAIPHKMIVLMGLDETIFPRKQQRPGFSLLDHKHFLGDPRINDKDRYVLLEALISTRETLLITWDGRDEKTGDSLEPSSPVQQFFEYLQHELGEKSSMGLLKKPSPNPLNKNNFLSCNNQPPISCDKRDLETRQWMNAKQGSRGLTLALPLNWNLSKNAVNSSSDNELLKSWLATPQLKWLEQFHLHPREWNKPIEDLDSLSIPELIKFKILKQEFTELITSSNNQIISPEINERESPNWQDKYLGQGVFPPKSAATLESEILGRRWTSLIKSLSKLGEVKRDSLMEDNETGEILIANNCTVLVEIGRLKAKTILNTWLTHLKLSAYHKSTKKTVVIARSDSNTKIDSYEVMLSWHPMSSIKAESILDELKQQAHNGLKQCWPVPPESGWKLAKARYKKSNDCNEIFRRAWIGDFNKEGERNKPEMQLCFGYKAAPEIFLENELFDQCLELLYKPLIAQLVK